MISAVTLPKQETAAVTSKIEAPTGLLSYWPLQPAVHPYIAAYVPPKTPCVTVCKSIYTMSTINPPNQYSLGRYRPFGIFQFPADAQRRFKPARQKQDQHCIAECFQRRYLFPWQIIPLAIMETEMMMANKGAACHRDHFTKPIPCLARGYWSIWYSPIRMENKMARLNGSAKQASIRWVNRQWCSSMRRCLKYSNQKIQPVDNIAGNIPKAAST